MILRRLVITLLVVAAIVAGCGDDSDSTADQVGQTTDSIDSTGDGDESVTVGAPVDLGDFPIPVPPGVEVGQPVETGGATAVQITFAVEDLDSVIAFYDDFTTSGSDVYQRTVAAEGGVIYTLTSGVDQNELGQIVVSTPIPGDDTTFATLTAGIAE